MIITPNWPVPKNIHAFTSVRENGNLAAHVGDDPEQVSLNRARLVREYGLPSEPYWLNQTHSDRVIRIDGTKPYALVDADGSYTALPNQVCAVLTADCLPLLLCSTDGKEIAALHAGWRGLLADIIARGVACFSCAPKEILVWLGPAIGPEVFEVGPEVHLAFVQAHPENAAAFKPSVKANHYLLDIYALARLYLYRLGMSAVYGGEYCTYTDTNLFYSYRREQQTGRMASLIWRLPT